MKKKDFMIIVIIAILAVALIFIFSNFANKEVAGSNLNANNRRSTNTNQTNSAEELVNANVNSLNNINQENKEVKFENFFKVAYLANFTGPSDPPVARDFAKDDKIVLSAITVENLETSSKMQIKIYKGNKEVSSTGEVSILNGEVTLVNPNEKGEYETRLFVDNTLVKSLPFTIN